MHNVNNADREYCFRRMERELCRRERNRLIRLKRIIPAHRMPATLLVKNDAGRWVQQLSR